MDEASIVASDDWENIFNTVAECITVHDLNFNIVRMNHAARQILGLQLQDQMPLAKCFHCYHGKDHPPADCPSCQTLKTGEPSTTDVFEPFLNRHLEISALPRYGSDGRLVGVIHIVKDITDRKRVEKALQESLGLYLSLFENMLNGFAYCRMLYDQGNPQDFIFLIVNDAFKSLTGLNDVVGKKASEVIPGICESDAGLMEIYGRVALTRKPEKFEYYVDALKKWFSISLYSPETEYFVAVFDVITERKQAEEALRESEERYRHIVETSLEGIWIIDEEFRTTFANKRIAEMLGYAPEEMLGRRVDSFIFAEDLKDYGSRVEARQRGVGETFERRFRRKDGATIWNIVSSSPLFDGDGRFTGSFSMFTDVTERKKAEEELQLTLGTLRKAVGATIQVMVSAVEMRDPYTAGHQSRSANLARAIATEMGLFKDKIDAIRMAGSIHDIGKLAIPAEILSKPTKLSEIEFSLIKEHVRQGYEVLKNIETSTHLAEIVYQHHERIDGSGYPNSLKGEAILVEAAILAVADVVEAMASHRPYRPSLGIEAALNEIEKNRGIFYDKDIADACLRLFREKGFKFEGD